jgi:hypothetical protein
MQDLDRQVYLALDDCAWLRDWAGLNIYALHE